VNPARWMFEKKRGFSFPVHLPATSWHMLTVAFVFLL